MNFLGISPYVFGTPLTWYSVFVLSGAILTYIISNYLYKRNPESKKCPDLILNIFLVGFPSGLVGARIWYILSEWSYYSSNPIEMLKVWEGGLAIQGGVALGAAMGIWYAIHAIRKHGINMKITHLMDLIIPNILIAQVVGRWGNFFNREVYGACVDGDKLKFLPKFIKDYMQGGTMAFTMNDGSVEFASIACPANQYAQPLFLYEGLLNLLGFILITIVLRKWFTKRVDGTLTALYLVWYGTVRACLEGLRNEMFIMRWGKISQSVVTSIVYVIVGVALLIYFYVSNYKKTHHVLSLTNVNETKQIITSEKKHEPSTDVKEEIKEEVSENNQEKSLETNKEEIVKVPVKKSPKTKETAKATSKKSTSTTKKVNTNSSKGEVKKTNAKVSQSRTNSSAKAPQKKTTTKTTKTVKKENKE